MAQKHIHKGSVVLDIGCNKGEFFQRIKNKIACYVGIDPGISTMIESPNFVLLPGSFPENLPKYFSDFSVVCALAVVEHIPSNKQRQFAANLFSVLRPNGTLIITTPSPVVDKILDLLIRIHMIDGMSAEQHYGFNPESLPSLYSDIGFTLRKRRKFELGLNNLFIFQKHLED
jgi:2-polyprenyl-3-methyl-5-hydroxy-6-metoxy-1,4-benzoquinol methylase